MNNSKSSISILKCHYCNNTFKSKKTLIEHIKTSKKCINNRDNSKSFKCIWCEIEFCVKDELIKHYKICNSDKETIYLSLLEKYNSLKEEKEQLKEESNEYKLKYEEAQNKLIERSNITNNNTTNNTYNITLVCEKPLLLDKDRVKELMLSTCKEEDVLKGATGLGSWFVKNVCTNENNKVCIQCTDKYRYIFKYIDENNKLNTIDGEDIRALLLHGLQDFQNTEEYEKAIGRARDSYGFNNLTTTTIEFRNANKKCIKHIARLTHKNSLLNIVKEEEVNEYEEYPMDEEEEEIL